MDIQSSDVTLRAVILVDCHDPLPCLSVCLLCLARVGLVSLEAGGRFVPLF
jgi:hypothetical protein